MTALSHFRRIVQRPGAAGLAAAALWLAGSVRADVELAPPFRDHAVLQRDQPVPVWGWAEPGETVTVSFGPAQARATAGADRRWSVTLGPLAANGAGADLVVSGQTTVTLRDVVVGDVWFCSGQSNMGRLVGQSLNSAQEIAAADFPLVRVLSVKSTVAEAPAATVATTGWQVASPATAGRFTAVGYFFARDLHRKLGIPIGIVHSSFGGTRIEAWMSAAALAGDPAFAEIVPLWRKGNEVPYPTRKADYDAALAAWETGEAAARGAGEAPQERFLREHRRPSAPMGPQQGPSVLFNGMVNPFVSYAVRGILWYQGESNVWAAEEYRRLFPALIRSWRGYFGGNDLPFYWVQLANFETNHNWAGLREAQAGALALPHTGQAVAIDIGDRDDIHPKNKQEVARRLALIAAAQLFGGTEEFSGPVLHVVERHGREMRLQFTHATGGLAVQGAAVESLEMAGADRAFHPAVARLEGDTLVVSSPAVTEPAAVRYAWSSSPHANLYNTAGLPAAPFRTDAW